MCDNNQQLAVAGAAPAPSQLISPFSDIQCFEAAQRMAKCLSASDLVPDTFQGEKKGTANCLIALELANRLRVSVFAVMQNMYVVHGRPAFSAQYIIAAVNACGRFSAIDYEKRTDDKGSVTGCRAYATELKTGEVKRGPEITLEMAKAEGWSARNPKWKNMPETMLMYRAATAFGRMYAPDVMMGFYSSDEAKEMEAPTKRRSKAAELNAVVEDATPPQADPLPETPQPQPEPAPAEDAELVLDSEEAAE